MRYLFVGLKKWRSNLYLNSSYLPPDVVDPSGPFNQQRRRYGLWRRDARLFSWHWHYKRYDNGSMFWWLWRGARQLVRYAKHAQGHKFVVDSGRYLWELRTTHSTCELVRTRK